MKDILLKELGELGLYVRTNFSIFVTWFTFFMTANLIATGWIVTNVANNKFLPILHMFLVCGGFVAVNIISVIMCRIFLSNLTEQYDRTLIISQELSRAIEGNTFECQAGLPINGYKQIVVVVIITLVAASIFWILLFFVHVYQEQILEVIGIE